ncbi:MAG: hypothetical protein ACOX6V_03285 [Patescibacteria group bacterium]|jgi:hypothetical protein
MKLFNVTQNMAITKKLVTAKSVGDKIVGLIGKKERKSPAMYFQTRWGIHTFGMKFPLTIIVCNSTFVVQAIKWNLLPNRVYFWKPRWSNIFELPAGKYPVSIGDKLELIT